MTDEEIVFATIAKVAKRPVDQITADWALNEGNGVDSLGFVEIAMSLESSLGVRLPDAEAAAAQTAGELVALCRRHIAR